MDQPGEEYYTADEAFATFRGLSELELDKLGRIASFIACSGGYAPPQELINESFIRIAEGKRRWPTNVAFLAFVGGVMKSLATDGDLIPEERKLVRLKQGLIIVNSEDLEMVAANDDCADLARKAQLEQAMSKLQAHFAGDGEMEMLLMGIEDGLRGKDLQEAVGVDAKRLEALRTRMNRQIEKLANESWAAEGRP
ncbi:transposase [Rhizobium leguminosarum]|uniref:transposase n=1 Tax=Rhizobium leguminosarum TaxID=384 RepID=UPI00293DF262|nr:transposase [Rhizobium leguminosarum]MDV4160579.1 transposase [Rhizobium leguminosarum]MDV4170308.1 transposase [Rhizobium leguminosarum]